MFRDFFMTYYLWKMMWMSLFVDILKATDVKSRIQFLTQRYRSADPDPNSEAKCHEATTKQKNFVCHLEDH
jgi:hypothetical protein